MAEAPSLLATDNAMNLWHQSPTARVGADDDHLRVEEGHGHYRSGAPQFEQCILLQPPPRQLVHGTTSRNATDQSPIPLQGGRHSTTDVLVRWDPAIATHSRSQTTQNGED